MPTGYTAGIEDGTITTGKDFLKRCTRAFGIAIELRGEPLSILTPTKFEPDTYYKDRLDQEKAELEHVKNMSFEDAKAKMVKSHEDSIKMYKSLAEKYIENNEKYAKVRAEVEAWNPPTAEHYNLKKFALEQIDMCTTCNYKTFEKVSIEVNGRTVEKLERGMGYGSLVMRCDTNGKNYTLGVRGEPRSEVRMYRCPTCGHMFLD